MPQNMGIGRIGHKDTTHKRQNRWMVTISPYIGDGISMLPPRKSNRPELSFSEIKADHIVESVSFPGRPEWGTLDITVYDIDCQNNTIFEWAQNLYDPQPGIFRPSVNSPQDVGFKFKIPAVTLNLFNGCGDVIEKWIYENCWPLKIQWGELEMSSSEVVTLELSLKYDRAYII